MQVKLRLEKVVQFVCSLAFILFRESNKKKTVSAKIRANLKIYRFLSRIFLHCDRTNATTK